MGFAYIDKGGVLHVVEKFETAREYASKKVVETEVPYSHGFPLHEGQDVTMYSLEEAYIGGNAGSGKKVDPQEIPEILDLYQACL